jgi:hypothetical protein
MSTSRSPPTGRSVHRAQGVRLIKACVKQDDDPVLRPGGAAAAAFKPGGKSYRSSGDATA